MNEVAVGSVDLNKFKSGFLCTKSGVAEAFYDLVDFRNGKYLRNCFIAVLSIEVRPRNSGRSFDGLSAEEFLTAAVFNLDCGNSAHFSDVFGKPRKSRNMLVV